MCVCVCVCVCVSVCVSVCEYACMCVRACVWWHSPYTSELVAWHNVNSCKEVAAALSFFKYEFTSVSRWAPVIFLPRLRCGPPPTLAEGVAEVNAPALQLLRVVWGHVGELSEDVQIRGVAWWIEIKKKENCETDDQWMTTVKTFPSTWLLWRIFKYFEDSKVPLRFL